MRFTTASLVSAGALLSAASSASASVIARPAPKIEERALEYVVKPKVMIISLFAPEAEIWYGIPEFDILGLNVTLPGASPLFPDVHCTADGEICQVITGESEINAAVTISSLVRSPRFDLTETYFFTGGIAGGNPALTTIGGVTFAKYAIQVALQHEFDLRDIPDNFTTGYVPLGSTVPDEYPSDIYGTEVFELNENLQKMAANFARNASLADSDGAAEYRAQYGVNPAYAVGASKPSVALCDVATSDVYYSGTTLDDAFANFTTLITNGSGIYCSTAQEDNAYLEVFVRAAVEKLVDFSRIIVMRTISNFDRPHEGEAATTHLFWATSGGFGPSVENIYRAGVKVVQGIVGGWNSTFAHGVNATNYVGDIFGTLGGEPDFGPGSIFKGDVVMKRDLAAGVAAARRRAAPKSRRNYPVRLH